MRSKERYAWRVRKGGLRSTIPVRMEICSKPQDYLSGRLLEKPYPETVLLWCDFPLSPYTFDIGVIKSLAGVCRTALPGAEIMVGGAFFDIFPKQAVAAKMKIYRADAEAVRDCEPDMEASLGEDYGLFQLSDGCVNSCSFCVAGRTKLRVFDNVKTVEYMKKLADAGIKDFWNLDQNVLMFQEHTADFFRKFRKSGIDGRLNFSLGFQPDRINDEIIEEMARVQTGVLTIPFETGTSASLEHVNKPYTIISSVKALDKVRRRAGSAVGRIICSFIIGYPHDDLRSVFRIYLAVLRLKAAPLAFSLYVFPNTREYSENSGVLASKDITSLHGQLWPLVPDRLVREYESLLKFLRIDDFDRAVEASGGLPPRLAAAFRKELAVNEAFVEMCLASDKEDIDTLRLIESKLDSPEITRPNILHIAASPRKAGVSASRIMGKHLCDEYMKKVPGCRLDTIDLASEPLAFINEEYTEFINKRLSYSVMSDYTKHLVDLTDKYIALLRKADRIVFSVPMYTLSIPSSLKCFFELVASRLFYDMHDKLRKRKVCCILTRDGVYGGKSEMKSVQEESLSTALGFIGLADEPKFVVAQGLFGSAGQSVLDDKSRKAELRSAAAWLPAAKVRQGQ